MASSTSLSYSFSGRGLFLLLFPFAFLPYGKASDVQVFSIHAVLPESTCSSSEAPKHSSVPVVHQHSPCSPFADGRKASHRELLDADQSRASSIQFQVSAAAAAAAAAQVDKLSRSAATTIPARTGASLGTGNYVVTLGFGTPRRDLPLILDTGSDVTWIQCAPCDDCYPQDDPLFEPSQSSTFAALPCSSPVCNRLLPSPPRCSQNTSKCRYDVRYGDDSHTQGTLAQDTLALSPAGAALPRFSFGCGDSNSGLFGRAAGLLGLGRGSASLASQATPTYGALFSYCLPSRSSSTGYLNLGRVRARANSTTKYTPTLTIPGLQSFYFVDLIAIKVGGKQLAVPRTVFSTAGALVDSGTVITRLPPAAYEALRKAFRERMTQYTPAPALSILDTCYNFTGYEAVSVPTVALVFARGASINVDFSGILYVASVSQACLAFAGNEGADDVAIVGNMQQKTYSVVYDVARRRIGFGAKGCS